MRISEEKYFADVAFGTDVLERAHHLRSNALAMIPLCYTDFMEIEHIFAAIQARQRISIGEANNGFLPKGGKEPICRILQKALRGFWIGKSLAKILVHAQDFG